jgi:hypothetical protein
MERIKFLILCAVVLLSATRVQAQNLSRAEYIERYKDMAIAHAEKYGIPASIKMAQGILESRNGNSVLAREGKTHFNIKVKASDKWRGEVIYHDDDKPNEPFRAYSSPEESWLDHSEYLNTQPRYDSLFRYPINDYRSWARGMKNCGYATDPLYAEKLIQIIEDSELWRLDEGGTSLAGKHSGRRGRNAVAVGAASRVIDIDRFVVAMNNIGGRALLRTSEGRFVVAHGGDTIDTISDLTGVRKGRIKRLNRVSKNAIFTSGQQIRID